MFWSYVKTVLRSISSSKVYSFINIAGLTIGFTLFTLIMLFVLNEFNYDTFNKKADRIYRVVEIQNPPGARVQQVAITMPELAPALKKEFPEVEDAARFVPWPTVLCHFGERRFYEDGLYFADSNFFDIFTFHFIEGNASEAFNGPYSVVIDQSTAKKYFGNANPIGKFISIDADLPQNSFLVTGVVRDFPLDSHLHFHMIASLTALERSLDIFNGWTNNDVVAYLLLKKGRSAKEVEKRLPKFLKTTLPQHVWSGLEMYLQPLKSIHLKSTRILYQVNYDKGNLEHVRMFIMIALFVIILACINFINLTTARSAIRTREVGIRKVLGSFHSHLMLQFIGESVVLSLIGFIISLPLVEALLPTFNTMIGERIIVNYSNQWQFLLMLASIAVTVGLFAGVYPAFYLSSFHPVELLRGRFSSTKTGILLRKALITLQFSIAIGLVTGTGIVIDQMNYVYNKPLGFNKRNLMYVPLRDTESRTKIPLITERLLADPRILSVSAGELTGSGGTQRAIIIPGTNGQSRLIVREGYVDYGYIKTMGMRITEGRDFSREFPSDSASVIINETMARTLGWKNPVGKLITMGSGEVFSVVGVVRDFNYFSLQNKIDPLVMWLRPDKCRYLVIRVAPQGMRSTIDAVEQTWANLMPHQPFEYGFLSDYLDSRYGNELQSEYLLALFSMVALAVACLGLFGLTLYTSEQRIKEIGVRKVLGASVFSIVLMLSKESMKLVAIAGAVAWPTAYFFMNKWLQNFEYKITINAWVFIISGLIVFLTAMLTMSFQAIKAGVSNPVNALRYE